VRPDPRAFREIVTSNLRELAGRRCAILLSGGVDSTSVLLALLELGAEVVAYSFTLERHVSKDFACARENAKRLDVPFVPLLLPRDRATLERDVRHEIEVLGLRKKADVEAAWPRLRALEVLEREGFAHLATGDLADGYYALSRRASIEAREHLDDARWRASFTRSYFARANPAQVATLGEEASRRGIDLLVPYRDEGLEELVSLATWRELNRPRQKELTRLAWPELDRLRTIEHTNLQGGDSGIARHFELLLDSPLNTRRSKSVVGVYNSLAREVAA
jgi:asparagine synthetase B (glutamine-hydrolysing)